MEYLKIDKKILDKTQDITETAIIGLIIQRYINGNNPKLQQTYIAKCLYISHDKVRKKLNSIINKGLLKSKPSYIIVNGQKKSTTEFIITTKLKELINTEKTEITQTVKTPTLSQTKIGEEEEINESERLQNIWRSLAKKHSQIIDKYK